MKKYLIIALASVTIFTAMLTLISATLTRGYSQFYNAKSHDNGLIIVLRGRVYDLFANGLCKINMDNNGAIPDVKIPLTKQTYIVFEVD